MLIAQGMRSSTAGSYRSGIWTQDHRRRRRTCGIARRNEASRDDGPHARAETSDRLTHGTPTAMVIEIEPSG